jgi:hypothetical protein
VKLPDIADLAIAKVRSLTGGQGSQECCVKVYFTPGSGIKRPKDVQQGAFAGARLAHNGQHLLPFHLKVDASKRTSRPRPVAYSLRRLRTSTSRAGRQALPGPAGAARPQAACGGFVCGGGQFHHLPLGR